MAISCIYLLSVDGKPRYVGQTSNLKNRVEKHRQNIEFVMDIFGMEAPIWEMRVLEEIHGRFALNAAERKWIAKMLPEGICNRHLPLRRPVA